MADPSVIEPESYTLDAAILARPGNADLQIELKRDYKCNIDRYPLYQDFFRQQQPKLPAIWGKNSLLPFGRDIPAARIVLMDTGHFALETEGGTVAEEMRGFSLG